MHLMKCRKTIRFSAILAIILVGSLRAQDSRDNWPDPIAGEVIPYHVAGLTHGPVIGQPTAESMRVWVRTREPVAFDVVYDTRLPLGKGSPVAVGKTAAERDNTGFVQLTGLKPDTRYYYGIRIGGALADTRIDFHDRWPSFRTLPNKTVCADPLNNPEGHFNVCFAISCCACQNPVASGGHYGSPPAFDTLLKRHGNEIMFFLSNGDTTYEELRDGTIDGIRANYKLYWERGRSFARAARNIPMLFTYNDHEMSGNLDGSGEIGLGRGAWLYRDPGVKVWQEYCGWANYPSAARSRVRFGRAQLRQGTDVLINPDADFSSLKPETVSTIHVGPYSRACKGMKAAPRPPVPKNAGVYGLVEVLDKNRLRVRPSFRATEEASYSIGTHHYFDWRLDNCHFFALETRGERTRFDPKKIFDKDRFILGETQRRWLLDGVKRSTADFIFIISPDPWTIYHTERHVNPKGTAPKGDGFASYVHEREILLEELDKIAKPVLIFTGDVHNSATVQITDNVWEFLCGPMSSTAHPIGTAGDPPMGGWWKSQGRSVKVKWIAGFPNNVHYSRLRNTFYAVVRVNNVAPSAKPEGTGYQWTAFAAPQVTVTFYDGYTGKPRYAEGISTADLRPRPKD
jgi:alkaline phosphatase D